MNKFIKPGDYLVVEDVTWWREKYLAVKKFMAVHGDEYEVDTKYADMFGVQHHLQCELLLSKKVGRELPSEMREALGWQRQGQNPFEF